MSWFKCIDFKQWFNRYLFNAAVKGEGEKTEKRIAIIEKIMLSLKRLVKYCAVSSSYELLTYVHDTFDKRKTINREW